MATFFQCLTTFLGNIRVDKKNLSKPVKPFFSLSLTLYLKLSVFYGLKFLRRRLFALKFSLMPTGASILGLNPRHHHPAGL